MIRRKIFVLGLAAVAAPAFSQSLPIPSASPVDAVAVCMVPTDGIRDEAVIEMARDLSKATGIRVKSTPWAPSGKLTPIPGTNQYDGEDYFPMVNRLRGTLADVNGRTYFLVVTDRDLNTRSKNFQFQFSMHNLMARTSVLSIARLLYDSDGSRSPDVVAGTRAQKLALRIVGEMRLGWKRTTEPLDIMYSPMTSVEDIDRLKFQHSTKDDR